MKTTEDKTALISSPGNDGGQEVEAVGEAAELARLRAIALDMQAGYVEATERAEEAVKAANALQAEVDRLRDTRPQPASTVLVERLTKALEWRLNEEGWQIADTFFGGYRVERNPHDHWCWGVVFHGEAGVGLNSADNFEAAKAAAQADFDERISSALSASTSREGDSLPADHIVLEQADLTDGRVSQTVRRPNGTEYERIVDGDEAYGSEE